MKKQHLTTLYHCVFNLQYHLVLVTKYRRRCISSAMLVRLQAIFRATVEKWGGELIACNGEPDHVHLFLSLTPNIQPSVFVNNLKTVSSRLIRKEFASDIERVYLQPIFWSRSYCLLTESGAPLSVLRQYIEQQEGAE